MGNWKVDFISILIKAKVKATKVKNLPKNFRLL